VASLNNPPSVLPCVVLCCVQAMGQLLLQLACAIGSLPSPSLDFAAAHYSPEFVRLLMLLLGVAEGAAFSWRAVSALLGERLLLDMDTLAIFNEQLVRGEGRRGRGVVLQARAGGGGGGGGGGGFVCGTSGHTCHLR